MDLVVGRIGKAHGVKGEVSVDVRTDDPERRFAPGSTLRTDKDGLGPLVVEAARPHQGRLLVHFEGVPDRTAAERLRGALLVVDAATAGETGDDEWWDHELAGLVMELRDGTKVGTVTDVVHTPGGSLLAVDRPDGPELLVPFVTEVVPEVDVPGGRVVLDPPPGLLDLDDATA